jgi:RNA polymerase sigma factor (sigma-70 family)
MRLSETDLTRYIEGMREGKKDDFEYIYNAFLPYAYFIVKNTYADKSEADDIVQEAFISAYKNIANLNNPASFASWFGKILNGAITSAYRKKKNVLSDNDESVNEAFDMKDDFMPEKNYESKESRRKVLDAVKRLPNSQRRVIIAFYFQDLKINEIAESLELSEGAIKNALYKARANLEKQLVPMFRDTVFTIPLPFIFWQEFESFSVSPTITGLLWNNTAEVTVRATSKLKFIPMLKTIGISHTAAVFITTGAVTAGVSITRQVSRAQNAAVSVLMIDSLDEMLGGGDANLLTNLCAEPSEARDGVLNALLARQNILPDIVSRSLDEEDISESFKLEKGNKRLYVIRTRGGGDYDVAYRFDPIESAELTEDDLLNKAGFK